MIHAADALLRDLEPTAAKLLDRHLATSKEWFPHELVPYSRGRDFVAGNAWDERDADLAGASLTPAVASALFVNLLTEDNLPYYFNDLERMFGPDEAWGTWGRRWTAEEGRHSIVIRDYLTVTRAIDPAALERARMAQVSGGETPSPADPQTGLIYLTLQELATRVAHRNTGKVIGDTAGYDVMARVAADENLHFLFYRDLATAAFEVDPSGMTLAVERQVRGFEMPGTGIPDFGVHAAAIAAAGIYDFGIHHSQILVPVVLRQWQLESIGGLTPEAEAARGRTVRHINRIERVGRRLAARREEQLAGSGARSG